MKPIETARSGGITIEAALFEGGIKSDWYVAVGREYAHLHRSENVRVNVWSDARVFEKIKPRILRKDPPDLFMDMEMPVWLLIATGNVQPFDAYLDKPPPGSSTPWRDLFYPGILDLYRSGDSVYAVPAGLSVWLVWYDAKLFREEGWQPPTTFEELDAVCDRARAEGLEPIAFQGKYFMYAWYTMVALIQRCGGVEAINRINRLEPGAFTHPDVVKAAKLLQNMAQRHFQTGTMAMTHTESQLQFINRKAALVFCGSWLESEMRANIPPDFELRPLPIPAVDGGKGNPRALYGFGSGLFLMAAESSHPERTADFLQYVISPERARSMTAQMGIISSLRGGTDRDAVSPALRQVLDMAEASPGVFDIRVPYLLLEWGIHVLTPQIDSLLRGDVTPEAFAQTLEEGVQRARHKPGLVIPPAAVYDPRQYGEAS